MISNYETAMKLLNNRQSRKLENNTYLKKLARDCIGVLLHDTYIIKYMPKSLVLFTGGWHTHTTKNRLNKYSGCPITQRKDLWYMPDGSLFYEGIEIQNGKVMKPKQPTTIEDKNKKLKSQIKKYVDNAIIAIEKGLPFPNAGDCWFCYMHTEGGQGLGDVFEDTDHLISHFKENYIVPSLVWGAIKEAGYRYPEIILGYSKIDESKDYSPDNMKTKKENMHERSIRRALVKYLYKRLGKKINK